MNDLKEPLMGRFSVEVDLANQKDRILVEAGVVSADRVRRVGVRGVVDNGATRLVIPQKVADHLGLETSGTARVRYANGESAERSIVENVQLSYGGRQSVFNAIVEPNRDSALIGVIVLEDLDFLVDCGSQRLVPRDPKQIVSEVE